MHILPFMYCTRPAITTIIKLSFSWCTSAVHSIGFNKNMFYFQVYSGRNHLKCLLIHLWTHNCMHCLIFS
uniref:Uncharacterized protein n=1 Tax=Anguilla anguilla TaxID=7936 RepID=A0A0E9SL63_ANGAN